MQNDTEETMPELPEVETIKTAIEKCIGCAKIEDAVIRNRRLRIPVPADAENRLRNTTITGYRRRAKYIVIDLDSGISIIWHMGMSGKVHITDTLPEPLGKHDHIIIRTSKGYLIYNDARRFGMFTYADTKGLEKHPLFAKMGPEPFDKALTADYLYNRLQKKSIAVKAALLDQEIIVGIGNIYASEALFGAKISPLRPANRISKGECRKLISEIQKTLKKAISAGGSTLRDYEKPDGSLGYFQNLHCVYNKTGQKCPQCTCDTAKTGGIRKIVIAGRSSFYCPQKQK